MQEGAHTPSFLRALADAFKLMFSDMGVLLLIIGAPILYSFFYPWFYTPEVVQRVPVAVVMHDNSSLSREMVRYASASPRLDVQIITQNEQEAMTHLRRGDIYGYALLRDDLKRRVLYGLDLTVPVYAHGGYPVLGKQVQYGFAEAFGTVNVGVQMSRLNAMGQSPLQASASAMPLSLSSVSLFNPTDGYATFVVAAVALLILQQTILMGSAVFVGTLRENALDTGAPPAPLKIWVARLCAPTIIGWFTTLYYFGWVFAIHGYPAGGNMVGALVLTALYAPAIVGIGALIGWWTANRERNVQIILFTSLAFAFVGGFSWPAEALPADIQFLRWFIPCTPGMQAALQLNQFGASLNTVLTELTVLLVMTVLSWTVFLRLATFKRTHQKPDFVDVQG